MSERRLLEAVIWFANVSIRETKQIEQYLASELVAGGYICKSEDFLELEPHEVERFSEDQEQLRNWLKDLMGGRLHLIGEVNRQVERKVRLGLWPWPDKHAFRPLVNGVEAICAYGMALLLDETRGAGRRLRRCLAPNCGRFHLDLDPGGRPRQFCSDRHRMAYHNSRRK